MSDNEMTTRPRVAGWMRLLLVVSLALNLLIAGTIGGMILRHDRGTPPTLLRDFGYGPFGAALSPTDRHRLAERMVHRSGDLRMNREEIRTDFAAILTLLRSEPFDAAALQALLERQQARLTERQGIGQALLLEQIEAMTPDERKAFADRMQRELKRFGRRHR